MLHHLLRNVFFAAFFISFSWTSSAQSGVVAVKLTYPIFYTSKLNVNGVALKDVTIVGDYNTLLAFFKSPGSPIFRNWFGSCAGVFVNLDPKSLATSYPANPKYKNYPAESGKIYVFIEDQHKFVQTFLTFAAGMIPPPVPGPHDPGYDPHSAYHRLELCEPEADQCVTLCRKKTEAYYEICCGKTCFVIKYDGKLGAELNREF